MPPGGYETACCAVGLLVAAAAAGHARGQAATYTPSQAEAGKVAYENVCGSCHMTNLAGAFEAPELAGANFLGAWSGRPVGDLFDYIKAAMPPAGQQPSDEAITNIVAYILQRNGMDAGDAPLTPTSDGALTGPANP